MKYKLSRVPTDALTEEVTEKNVMKHEEDLVGEPNVLVDLHVQPV